MFSVDNFYYVLYKNLLESANILPCYFYPFGTTESKNFCIGWDNPVRISSEILHSALFFDQEPLLANNLNYYHQSFLQSDVLCKLLANSEKSSTKNQICKNEGFLDWYYFYHGFASLFWLSDYKYFADIEFQFTKLFISLNRLHTNYRSYRLNLVSEFIKNGLVDKGIISLPLGNSEYNNWHKELDDPFSLLNKNKIQEIKFNLSQYPSGFTADTIDPKGFLSADCGTSSYKMSKSAFIHVVGETIFYQDKLHLTEKIFKPIATKRPFLLAAAPGNLQYLKSYGFQSFSKWIDESYDNELDPDKRIEMIVHELTKLSRLNLADLKDLHMEMKPILDYNFNHFYTDFRENITDELLENFRNCINIYNNGRFGDKVINLKSINSTEVRKRLLR